MKKKQEHGAASISLLIKKPKQETASTSTNSALTRSKTVEPGNGKLGPKMDRCVKDVQKKGSDVNAYAVCTNSVGQKNCRKEANKFNFTGRFTSLRESGASAQGKRFRVTMLQEGLGNLKDCYFYTKDSIQSAVPVFEGQHFFINHPKASEEIDRPERDINDLTGYFENCAAEPGKDDPSRTDLCGDLVLITGAMAFDRYRALIMESLSYVTKHPDKDLVGLSINANGDNSEQPLDLFMQEYQVPQSCMDKLLEAQGKGVQSIKPVTVIMSATSCDLVTSAGAGGRINRLLEKNKTPEGKESMGHKQEQEEKKFEAAQEEHEEKHEETEEHEEADDATACPDGEHADEQQDIELIKKMLAKYVGDGFNDEDHQNAHEALKHAEEMGLKGEEAMKCAGYHMKMAKHMQAKQEAQQSEESGAGPEDQKSLSSHSPNPVSGEKPPKTAQHQQSRRESSAGSNEIVKMAAEVARLSAELNTMRLERHVEKSLRESKLPMSATKKFRECIKNVRTTKDFDEKLKTFKEGFNLGGEAEESAFVLNAERSDFSQEVGLNFSDCKEE